MKLLLTAPSTRAIAESAKKAGYDFISLDFFGDADQKEICENHSLREFKEDYTIENLFKCAQDLEFTHVVYGSGFENHPELVGEFEKRCTAQARTVLGNSCDTLRKVRYWKNFFKVLEKNGIPFPQTEILPKKEAIEALESKQNVIKPLAGGGGHAIYDSQSVDKAAADERLGEEVLLQEYIAGIPASSTFISSSGEFIFLGTAEQLRGTFFSPFCYSGNVVPLKTRRAAIEKMKEISRVIAEAFKLKGCNGIDVVINNGEPYVLEVNPRIPGSAELLEMAHGFNVIDVHIKACLGNLRSLKLKTPRKFYAKKILFADREVKYNIANRPGFVRDVPHHNERIQARAPICTVFAEGKTRRFCLEKLHKNEAKIKYLSEKS